MASTRSADLKRKVFRFIKDYPGAVVLAVTLITCTAIGSWMTNQPMTSRQTYDHQRDQEQPAEQPLDLAADLSDPASVETLDIVCEEGGQRAGESMREFADVLTDRGIPTTAQEVFGSVLALKKTPQGKNGDCFTLGAAVSVFLIQKHQKTQSN